MQEEMMEEMEELSTDLSEQATIVSAEVNGDPGNYSFSVGIASPDTGCDQYADWWEVITADGDLLYRRILAHSHVGEQPFVRSGGPVNIQADEQIIIRAHMNNSGYGLQAMVGTVQDGFQEQILSPDFHLELADVAPLPDGCAF